MNHKKKRSSRFILTIVASLASYPGTEAMDQSVGCFLDACISEGMRPKSNGIKLGLRNHLNEDLTIFSNLQGHSCQGSSR